MAIGADSPAARQLDGVVFCFALTLEFALGTVMGIAASLLYDGAYAAGRIVDDYVGVKAIAPSVQLVAPSGFGRVWSNAFTGGFFLLGAYRTVILALRDSFDRVPPGVTFDAHAWTPFAISLGSTIVAVALSIAGPAVGITFAVQIALGAVSRAVPRLGTFALSFPLVFGAALIVTALAVPIVANRAANPILALPVFAR